MQIELIGCTSAGKTTLAQEMVQRGRRQGMDIVLAETFVLELLHLHWIRATTLRKVAVNCAGLVASVLTWHKNGRLYRFAIQMLRELPISRAEKLALLRNVLKKVGIGELARVVGSSEQIIVLDEGALHIAHNLFVHTSTNASTEMIPEFVKLAPLPDVVVYVREDESPLIERVMVRGHHRIANPSHESVACFVRQAVVTFDRLVEEPDIKRKLILVQGGLSGVSPATTESEPVVASIAVMVGRLRQAHVA